MATRQSRFRMAGFIKTPSRKSRFSSPPNPTHPQQLPPHHPSLAQTVNPSDNPSERHAGRESYHGHFDDEEADAGDQSEE